MKKTIIVLLALFLALPAISFAGSVTSRWDMTIGGYVKFDLGYADKGIGVDHQFAQRDNFRGTQSVYSDYGNWYAAGGETRLNMLIKGPDGLGAKTSAFIEGDLRGNTTSGYGSFMMRHAFMTMAWPNSTLTIGHTWQRWGFIPSFAAVGAALGYQDLGAFAKGTRQPRIDYEYRFGPGFSAALAVIANTNTLWNGGTAVNGGVVNNGTRSDNPWFEGEFKYNTEKCGKIGPYGLMAALGAFYGNQKQTYNIQANPSTIGSDNVAAWAVSLKGFIPIIPEKNKNKAGALAIGGNLFYGQNMTDWFFVQGNPGTTLVYAGPSSTVIGGPTWESPTGYGGWGQVTYFFTDKLFVNGYYGYLRNNLSDWYSKTAAGANAVKNHTEIILNVAYDVNQAMRFGIQYEFGQTTYGNYRVPTAAENLLAVAGAAPYYLDKQGSYNTVRVGAWYFF